MSLLGRRKHSRYLLAQPIDGRVQVRDEVTVELLDRGEIVALAAESCRPDEHVVLEILGNGRQRISARVLESKPVVAEDGVIRHRVRLAPVAAHAPGPVVGEGGL